MPFGEDNKNVFLVTIFICARNKWLKISGIIVSGLNGHIYLKTMIVVMACSMSIYIYVYIYIYKMQLISTITTDCEQPV